MKYIETIETLKAFKDQNKYTLNDLSKILDIQVTTIERWFRTKRINKIYALYVEEKLRSLQFQETAVA